MANHRIDRARVKMRAGRAYRAWYGFMEEMEQVVMESDGTICGDIYRKMRELSGEVGDALREASNG